MNAKAWRLYAAGDARLEDVELEGAGEDGVVVEIVTNTICLSDYKAVSLGTGHKRVPKDIATNPTMFGHEISGIVREVGAKWASQFTVGQRVCIQPAFNIPGHELETMGYAWHSIGGETTHVHLPSIIMEMGCLLPYDGDAFFKCSLAEPISCIVSAFRTNYHHFVSTRGMADPVAALKAYNLADEEDASNPTSTGGGYDDIFLFAPVPALITQCSDLLSFGGCLNFFAGPTDQKLSAPFNFYNIHYMMHHIVANSGGDVKDMADSVDWIGRGYLHPEVMITHVGGLPSAAQATLDLPTVPGGKRLVYTHVDMLDALSCFFANIPANITVKREKYYQTLFYAVFVLIGARTHAECWTNRGRVDAVVETPCGIYVFEFKLNGTASAALAQIKEKGYHEKYLRRGKKVTLVGAAFDAEMRNLSDRQIEVAADS